MSGFLSKSKQRFEHTSKLNVGEFKSLQSLIGQEKNLLNSHVRVANDLRKASHSLDEWAQSEGPDLAVSLILFNPGFSFLEPPADAFCRVLHCYFLICAHRLVLPVALAGYARQSGQTAGQ